MATIPEALAVAGQYLQAGHLREAEQIYRQIVQVDPNHAEAWCRLGMTCLSAGRSEEAMACCRRALEIQPGMHLAEECLARARSLGSQVPSGGPWGAGGPLLSPSPLPHLQREGGWSQESDNLHARAVFTPVGLPPQHPAAGPVSPASLPVGAEVGVRLARITTVPPRHIANSAIPVVAPPPQEVMEQAVQHNRQAIALFHQGRLAESAAQFQRAVQLWPTFADALSNLGNVYFYQGHYDRAVTCYHEALQLKPDDGGILSNLANTLCHQGHYEEAVARCRRAIQLEPENAGAYNNLANALRGLGKDEEALANYQKAVQLKPDYFEAYNNLGQMLNQMERYPEAAEAYRQALHAKPDYVQAHLNLGDVLLNQFKPGEAVPHFEQALRLSPPAELLAEIHNQLGRAIMHDAIISQNTSQSAAAVAHFDQAIVMQPQNAIYRWNRALALLTFADLGRAWADFEWRLRIPLLGLNRNYPQPRWDGSDLAGRAILLYTEGGFGDALQFIRFAPLVVERGGKVFLECQPELKALLQTAEGPSQVFARGEPLPSFDVQAPLQSLPFFLGTTLETIPVKVPYLKTDPSRVAKWKERLSQQPPGFRVGLVWAGKPKAAKRNDAGCPLETFRPLAEVPGVTFYSLQKGMGDRRGENPAEEAATSLLSMIDWTADLKDFADTAALVSQLDLVISVDTSMVHLTGALGKPIWTLLPLVSDFRWLVKREDSPWYPTMRLFRQTAAGGWAEMLQRVAVELKALVGSK